MNQSIVMLKLNQFIVILSVNSYVYYSYVQVKWIGLFIVTSPHKRAAASVPLWRLLVFYVYVLIYSYVQVRWIGLFIGNSGSTVVFIIKHN